MRALLMLLLLMMSGCRCSSPTFNADEAARICMTLQTCSPKEFSANYFNSLEACTTTPSPILPWPGTMEREPLFTTGLEAPFRDLYRCVLAAQGDCSRVAACWALDGDAGSCANRAGLVNGNCEGETLAGCTLDGQRFQVDCVRYSQTCSSLNFFGNFEVCAAKQCSGPTRCQENKAELCSGDSVVLWDCEKAGKKCEERADGGGATCVFKDKTCDPKLEARCEGSVAIACEGLGFEVRVDCAANPTRRRCEAGACVDTGTECSNLKATCEGSAVKFCQDGFLRTMECARLGLGRCVAGRCTL